MSTTQYDRSAAALAPQAILPVAGAILLGVFVLFGVAFAGPEVIHNAAHDSRHAFAFPCH